ncbi:MAG: DUF2062 domain-containing protein [Caldiserica bacterium]|nr:DUF2062 domain-containing protein [Caldisericota bacterium]
MKSFFHKIKANWIRSQWQHELAQFKGNNKDVAISLSAGVFIGFTPTVGFQTILDYIFSRIFKKSFILTYLGSSIVTGIPPLIPFVYLFSYKVGEVFLGEINKGTLQAQSISIPSVLSWKLVPLYGKPLLIGSFIMAVIGGLITFAITFLILNKTRRNA